MNIILLGAPGAGKGTQATRISGKYGLPHISTGDIFRDNIKRGTEIGLLAKSYTDKGQLVPVELTCKIVEGRLREADCEGGYLLDGFPRTVPQAEALDEMGVEIDRVIEIDVPDEVIESRLGGRRVCESCGASYHVVNKAPAVDGICDKCGGKLIIRKDDKPETIKDRLAVYHEQTAPLADYYRKAGKLFTVDGTQEISAITAQLLSILEA